MEGLEGLFSEPDGPAYAKREERVGPPLEYVREKIGNSLRTLHDLAHNARGLGSDDVDRRIAQVFSPLTLGPALPQPKPQMPRPFRVRHVPRASK